MYDENKEKIKLTAKNLFVEGRSFKRSQGNRNGDRDSTLSKGTYSLLISE